MIAEKPIYCERICMLIFVLRMYIRFVFATQMLVPTKFCVPANFRFSCIYARIALMYFSNSGCWRTAASCGRRSAGQPRSMVSWGTRWSCDVKTTLTRRSKSQQRRYGTPLILGVVYTKDLRTALGHFFIIII